LKTFEEFGLSETVLKAIKEMDFIHPTPIQEKIIPLMAETKSDIIGLAQTGTGKTAAFGLPLVQETDVNKAQVQSLILCPTRELCVQITNDLLAFSKYVNGLRVVPVYGGASIDTQIQSIKRGAHIVVATPGRMLDLLERKRINIQNIRSVVLDEADEMLNMGFREDLNSILSQTPATKRVLMFSATMSKEIANIASNYMNDPVEIMVGRRNEGAENVKHIFYMVHSQQRYLAMKRIVDVNPDIYGLVFCRTRQETKDIAEKLIKDGYNADALHGDLSQAQRDSVMKRFRARTLQMLVATDVAARGIDVDDISHVINFNLPDETELYTHRSGRTGRAGKNGVSVVIIHAKEQFKIKQLEKLMNKKFEQKKVPGAKEICENQLFTHFDKFEKVEADTTSVDPFLEVINQKLALLTKEDIIRRMVTMEFSRLLDYYKNAPDLNQSLSSDVIRKGSSRDGKNFTRFFVNIGSMDSITKSSLIGVINDATTDRSIEIGRIDIMPRFSFFEVPEASANAILTAFKEVNFEGRKLVVDVAQDKKSDRGGGDYQRSDRSNRSDDRRSSDRRPDSRRPDSRRSSDDRRSGSGFDSGRRRDGVKRNRIR